MSLEKFKIYLTDIGITVNSKYIHKLEDQFTVILKDKPKKAVQKHFSKITLDTECYICRLYFKDVASFTAPKQLVLL